MYFGDGKHETVTSWVLDVNNLFLSTPAKLSRCCAKMCIWIDKVDVDFPQRGMKLNTVVVRLHFA